MKNIKMTAAAIVVIVLAFAAMYSVNAYTVSVTQTSADIYTCPMHPEVTQDSPGQCPKCGMDLVLKSDDTQKSEMMKCENMDKCKEMGCEMDSCKGSAGACNENCTGMKDHKDMDMNEHEGHKKMDHKKCMGH